MPFMLPILGAMGGAALGGANAILPSKAERENKKKIRELEMNALGLTPQERAALEAQYSSKMSGATEAAARQGAAFGAAGQAGSGAALARQGAAFTEATKQGREVAADLAAANEQKKSATRQEIQDRKDLQAEYRSNRRQAIADIGSAGLEAYQMQKGIKDLTQQKQARTFGKVDPARMDALTAKVASMDEAQWTKVRDALRQRGVTDEEIAYLEQTRADATILNAGVK